jgi:hypothetical protein
MFNFIFWKKWVGFQFTRYWYDGWPGDGRMVTDWMLYVGFWSLTKKRIN